MQNKHIVTQKFCVTERKSEKGVKEQVIILVYYPIFPLKYFLGDNRNAIEIQIWVTMIAYLLLRVMQTKAKSKLAF